MSAIGQIYYRVVDTSSTGEGRHYISSGIDIYNDVVSASSARQFTKVGIQAPPGAQVVMNASKTIMIGRTGIYELDEDIAITSMYFVRPKNYIKDEEETELKKQQGEKIIKDAKAALEAAIKALGEEPADQTSEAYKTYWNGYNEANDTYIAAFQEGSATLNQGLNGVYKLDEDNPYGDLENVIVDFIYDPSQG